MPDGPDIPTHASGDPGPDISATSSATSGWYSDEQATFGDRLTGAREAAGLKQGELAQRLGVQVKTLRMWENDLNAPRANRLSMMSGILNVSLVWLMTGQGDGIAPPPIDDPDADTHATGAQWAAIRELSTELAGLRHQANATSAWIERLEKRVRAMVAQQTGST